MQASESSGNLLNDILRIYGECSGQAVNKEKISIVFSPNTPAPVRQQVKLSLLIGVEAFSERYLGLPTAVGRITSGMFDHIRERILAKLQGGVERMLSCAGREIRLKTVAQAIPTFSMSCFKLTRKVCKSLVLIMGKYWWSSSVDRRSLHWLSWDVVSKPKKQGGMGFRDLELFNIALLGKHWWRLTTNLSLLCARVLKGKYFPDGHFMQATAPRSSSTTWRAIIAGKETLQLGLIKRVGTGSSISIWEDKWVPTLTSMTPSRVGNSHLQWVSEVIDSYSGLWNIDLVRQIFSPTEAEAILNIPLRAAGGEDVVAWAPEKSGIYTVKTSYRSPMNQKEQQALDEGTATETPVTEQQMWSRLWDAYAENVPALLGKDQWNIVDPGFKLHSPVLTRPPGRPRKNRITTGEEGCVKKEQEEQWAEEKAEEHAATEENATSLEDTAVAEENATSLENEATEVAIG
ncbi:Alanyl-tRNA synthetase [Hordeum vulgare]|nr:Alanyl-tRNA synthetase [Hordeum vulgare]